MVQQAGAEVLTIRIPMRLERRGGRKLIVTPEGATAAPRKPTRASPVMVAVRSVPRSHRTRSANGAWRSPDEGRS
jgi:hypothetical protein